MLTGYIFFLLLCILTLLLLSHVVLRFSKGEQASLSIHFVFLSIKLRRGDTAERRSKKKRNSQAKARGAFFRALRYALPRTTVYIARLPLPTAEDPFLPAIAAGGYHFLLSILLAPFKKRASQPLLESREDGEATLDLQFRMPFYAFLHTFLIYMAQYRKEKEAENFYGRSY